MDWQHHPPSPPALGASILLIPGSTPRALTPHRTRLGRRSVHAGGIQAIPMECWRRWQRNREVLGALRERKRFSAFQAQLSSTEQSSGALTHSPSLSLARRDTVSWRFCTGGLRMGISAWQWRGPAGEPLLGLSYGARGLQCSESHHSKGQGVTWCLSVLTSSCWWPQTAGC